MKLSISNKGIFNFYILLITVLLAVCTVFLLRSTLAIPVEQELSSRNADVMEDPPAETIIENLRAFTKLYGYVKYFHPSDQANAIDWERFAVYGIENVMHAKTRDELRDRLQILFHPIAPTVQIYYADEQPPNPVTILTPDDVTGLELVAWQHRGVGLGNRSPYRSIRLNRQTETSIGPGFGPIIQRVDASLYRGKEIRLEGHLKTEVSGSGNQAQLWLRVDLPESRMGFFDNMRDRPVTSPEWQKYQITGNVAEDAEHIVFGGFLSGKGKAWFDNFKLYVRNDETGGWTSIPLTNADFDEGETGDTPVGWSTGASEYRFITTDSDAYEGKRSLLIISSETRQMADPLFEARPEAGEVVERPLNSELAVQIPLALYSSDGQTLQPEDTPPLSSLESELENISPSNMTVEDKSLRYANIAIAWNIFQHFYPYFDVVNTDWDAVLTKTLEKTKTDSTPEDLLNTLRWMVAQLDDGHGNVQHPVIMENAGLPFLTDEVEEKIVIVAVKEGVENSDCFQRGDIVVSVDGIPSEQIIRKSKEYISGSPQWKTYRSIRNFGHGKRGKKVTLVLERPGGSISCEVVRNTEDPITEKRSAPIEILREGIYYVDLSRSSMDAIDEELNTLAEAKGIVFDLRGYPNGNHGVLQHLSTDTLRSAHWQVPRQIYPDQMDILGYDTSGRWTLEPKEPHFPGKIVFLTDARAISYAESVMGIVEHYELAEIVGQPTAGANGNVNPFTLPRGYRIWWTGMRVVKHDRSQHHLIGIQPTEWVERTVEGVRAGRDEYLEKALELIETSVDQ